MPCLTLGVIAPVVIHRKYTLQLAVDFLQFQQQRSPSWACRHRYPGHYPSNLVYDFLLVHIERIFGLSTDSLDDQLCRNIAKSAINFAFALALALVRRFLDLLAVVCLVVHLAMVLVFAFAFVLKLLLPFTST